MKADEVDKALHAKFFTEDERLVFWHDENGEFTDYVAGGFKGELSNVKVLDVAAVGGLSAKLRLEREDATGKYLVYSHGKAPQAEEDWLLDIRLYGAQFHADVASLWLQELGLSSLSLRDHLKARASFLGNQERRKKLARLVSATDDEAALDLKMLAVLTGSTLPSAFDVLRSLCHGHVDNGEFDLIELPEAITTFEKMGLLDRFWHLMHDEFAYTSDNPTVAGLLRKLFITELFEQTGGAPMESLAQHRLPAPGRRNAVVFLTQWRDSSATASSYDAVAAAVAREQRVDEPLSALELETIKDVYTFWDAERRVVKELKERVLSEMQSVDVESVTSIASARKSGHWLSGPASDAADRQAIAHAYDAIVAAAELFALHREQRQSIKFETPADLLGAYQKVLYRFDRLYRRVCRQSKPAMGQGWDLLKSLVAEVERVYDQGFIQPLGLEWSRLLDDGFLGKWVVEGLPAQQSFYAKYIGPYLAEADRKRAFVIISDAFRFEAATELTEALNGQFGRTAELSAMLGVLPSYTALGMASLLPHNTLAYNEKGDVLVDGKAAAGTEARRKHLATVDGMACQAKDLRAMKKDEAREYTEGKRVVYIYHNVIDARGDSAPTEGETFEAVSECIGEIADLVQICINKLSASKVWITADHGFLFQLEPPGDTDKSALSDKPDHAVTAKKRYVIGRDLGPVAEAHRGSTEITSGAGGGMEFWVPRSANRFHFVGGARFVHGGAMPQEIVVPLITVTHLRGKEKHASRSEKVAVQVLGTNHKITTPKYRFEFIQTEAVGERMLPITVRAAVYDGADVVSSVETVVFDSASKSLDERKKAIGVALRTGKYDKLKPYRLVLRDAESDAEVQSVPVVIDRSFDDDF